MTNDERCCSQPMLKINLSVELAFVKVIAKQNNGALPSHSRSYNTIIVKCRRETHDTEHHHSIMQSSIIVAGCDTGCYRKSARCVQ